jgi:hypothetical protein
VKTKRIDVAYGGFLLSGVIIFLAALVSYIPMSTATAGGIGLLIFVPLSVLGIIGLLAGILSTAIFRLGFQLSLLSVMSLLFLAEAIGEFGSWWFYNGSILLYGTASILMSLRWFLLKGKA